MSRNSIPSDSTAGNVIEQYVKDIRSMCLRNTVLVLATYPHGYPPLTQTIKFTILYHLLLSSIISRPKVSDPKMTETSIDIEGETPKPSPLSSYEVENDVEMAEVATDVKIGDDSDSDYIRDAYSARLGLINNVRISQYDEKFSQIAYTRIDYREDKGAGQTEKQAQFESLFMKMDPDDGGLTSTIARLRVEFVKPYDDINDRLGEWSQLSLIMRLNLVESLQQVEKAGEIKFDENIDRRLGDGEEAREQKGWIKTKDIARRLRISCERTQILCKDPKNWSQYKTHQSKSRQVSKKGEDDSAGHGKGKGLAIGKPRVKPQTSATKGPTGTQGTGTTPFTTPAAKKVSLWENLKFPTAKEEEFKGLLASDEIEDIDPTRQPKLEYREHYAGEEYRFLYRWMEAKNDGGKTKWADGTPACDQLERAHKHFFTEYPFDDKTQSKTRRGRAILRALTAIHVSNAAVKEKFAVFFSKGTVKKESKIAEQVEEGSAEESGGVEMMGAVGPQQEDSELVSDEEQLPDANAEGDDDSEGGDGDT
ncbi:hypothetical protein EG327_002791 [Venturia inaequalis]|uniref:Uncharacterized protein n=1 Tax=Venturia inaequalis TaxID=5025 RepID=A0A8H3VR70_VENIN|nr:hypothetical protein EG327_002791 [Venturia inaequalis]